MAGAAAALDGATTAAATAAAGEGERGAAVAAAAAATAAAVPRPVAFGALRSLYLTRTGVRSWADVDAIGRLPALRDIRIAEVPVLLRVPGAEGGTVDAGAPRFLSPPPGWGASPQQLVGGIAGSKMGMSQSSQRLGMGGKTSQVCNYNNVIL